MFLDGVFLVTYRHFVPGSGPPMLINLLFFYLLMFMLTRLPYFRRGMRCGEAACKRVEWRKEWIWRIRRQR